MSKQKRDIENSEDRQTGTGRGCDVTTNPGGTRKTDNLIKGIRNPIPGTWMIPKKESRI